MPLSLIVGPPNSGRAGEVRRRFVEAAGAEPLLVVPTGDDVARFERELCGGGGALIGGMVTTFDGLFEQVAAATGAASVPLLTAVQRRRALALAVWHADLGPLEAISRRPGFLPALDQLIAELQAARIDPEAIGAAAAENGDGEYLRGLGTAFRAYLERREALGRGDRHSRAGAATAALRRSPDAWGGRPVLAYGFDDLTDEQLELIRVLAGAGRVTVAVTYEDRTALAARATLLERLRDLGLAEERGLAPNPSYTESATLFALERGFLVDDAERAVPDGGLRLMSAAGERAEAEAIGSEIGALLAAGHEPSEIAIALRSPERLGPLYATVLDGLGVPAAVHAHVPLRRTAAGTGLLALLRAALTTREAADLVAYLRTPGAAPPGDVDWLERAVRRGRVRDAGEAQRRWRGRELGELDALREAGSGVELCRALAAVARGMAAGRHRRSAPGLTEAEALEARAATLAAEAAEELADPPALAPGPEELADALEAIEVPLRHGPGSERVQVASPYHLRAGRFSHLFVASLQEGEFPAPEPRRPFLSDEQRGAIGLPPRADPEAEERYLLYVCLSSPIERLYLSSRHADEAGNAAAPSPFLEEVRELLDPPPPRSPGADDPLPAALTRIRGPAEVVLEAAAAPTADELARSLAARGWDADHRGALAALDIGDRQSAAIATRLERAAAVRRPLPGPLSAPAVLGELAERRSGGASTLEAYAVCSYRWFVDHELSPERLDPRPEQLDQGSVVHRVLERLYRDPPGSEPLPRRESLAAWERRAGELLAAEAADAGLGPHDAARRAGLRRMETLIGSFLAREVAREWPLRPEPGLLEAEFGAEHEVGGLRLGEFELKGKIDRVDVAQGAGDRPLGVIRDYKLSRNVTSPAKLPEEGKLQLQLYMLALRELFGVEPIGGLYEPLAAEGEGAKARGPLREAARDGPLPAAGLSERDFLADEELEAVLAEARAAAIWIAAGMRAGRIGRNPLGGACPHYCTFQPICRRERAAEDPEEVGVDEGDEER